MTDSFELKPHIAHAEFLSRIEFCTKVIPIVVSLIKKHDLNEIIVLENGKLCT